MSFFGESLRSEPPPRTDAFPRLESVVIAPDLPSVSCSSLRLRSEDYLRPPRRESPGETVGKSWRFVLRLFREVTKQHLSDHRVRQLILDLQNAGQNQPHHYYESDGQPQQHDQTFPRGELRPLLGFLFYGEWLPRGQYDFESYCPHRRGGPPKSGSLVQLCNFEVQRSACH